MSQVFPNGGKFLTFPLLNLCMMHVFVHVKFFEYKQDVNKKQTPSKFGPLILGPFIIRIGIACVHPEKRRVGGVWWR